MVFYCPFLGKSQTINNNTPLDLLIENSWIVDDSTAKTLAQNANEIVRSLKNNDDKSTVAYVYYHLGYAFLIRNKYEESTEFFSKAISLSKKTSFDSTASHALKQLGWLHDETGNIDSALYYLDMALEIYEKNADQMGVGHCYRIKTSSFLAKSDFPQALEFGLKSIKILKSSPDPFPYLQALQNTANVYQKLENFDDALTLYDSCYALASKIGRDDIATQALNNKAVVYYNTGRIDQALQWFERSITFYEKAGNNKMLAVLYNNIAPIYYDSGEEEMAIEIGKKSLLLAQELELSVDEVYALTNLAIFHKRNGNYKQAENYYLQAIDLAEAKGYQDNAKSLYKFLSFLYAKTDDYEKAFKYYRKYEKIKSSILNDQTNKQIAELQTKFKTEEAQAQILAMKNDSQIKELDNQRLRAQRNIFMISFVTIGLIMFLLIRMYRTRQQNNKIINEQRIRQMENEQKLLAARSTLEGQERERQRMARELHDGIGVMLSSASIHFSNLEEKTDDGHTSELANTAFTFLQKAGTEVRRISHNMMPIVLSKFGLCDALEDLFEDVADTNTIEVHHAIDGSGQRFEEKTEIMIYRIVQEMLNNTLKHAKASQIEFNLQLGNGKITIHYKDNGKGFDRSDKAENKSLGLSGITTRADYLKAELELQTKPGSGCRYNLVIPIEEN